MRPCAANSPRHILILSSTTIYHLPKTLPSRPRIAMAAAASGSGAPPPPPNNNPHGFLNPRRDTLRVSKIKWSEANDIKLLLLAMGRELKAEDYQAIADSFPGTSITFS